MNNQIVTAVKSIGQVGGSDFWGGHHYNYRILALWRAVGITHLDSYIPCFFASVELWLATAALEVEVADARSRKCIYDPDICADGYLGSRISSHPIPT